MDPSTLKIDASNHRLRRVGRLVRRRMRIDGANLTNGIHSDGRLSVVIAGAGPSPSPTASPQPLQWWSDRPLAMVIIRSTVTGEDVSIIPGPIRWGRWDPPADGGVSYIAFCYDTEPDIASSRTSAPNRQSAASILARLLRSGSPA